MKIAFIIGSLAGGGAERVVSELATEMSAQGHEIAVIVVSSNKKTYYIPEAVRFIDCAKNYKLRGIGYLNRINDIKKELKSFGAEVCISFNTNVNFYAVFSCVGLPCSLVLSERNDPVIYPKSKISRLMRKILYRGKFRYVFQTEQAMSFFSEKIQRNSCVIFNPLNPDLPTPFVGERSKRIVTAVRLEPQKNLKMAIDAFSMSKAPDNGFVFEIYGDGSLKGELTDYIISKNLKDKIILKGNSSTLYDDISDAYAFVLSSDYEGMSNSMLEAMALGIPTISTDYPSGGAKAVIIDGHNGILVPVGDVKAMTDALNNLIDDSDYANSLSSNSEKLRYELSVERITKEWLSFIS